MRSLSIILLCFVLVGCCKPDIVYKDRIVHVDRPVIQEFPKAPEIPATPLPTDKLTENSTDEETAKAYVSSLQLLKNEIKQLRKAIKPYQKP